MKYVVCAVYDTDIGAFVGPAFFRSKAESVRSFTDAVTAEKSQLAKHSSKFKWFVLGEWDDSTGLFVQEKSGPQLVISADECMPR